ncbi:MAG: outer membrane protein assembly factor BamB family protein [Thermogutta sp.]
MTNKTMVAWNPLRIDGVLSFKLLTCLLPLLLAGRNLLFSGQVAGCSPVEEGSEIVYHPEWYSEVWALQPDQLAGSIAVALEPIPQRPSPNNPQQDGEWFFRRLDGLFRIPGRFGSRSALKLGLVKPENVVLLVRSAEDCVIFRYYPDFYQSWVAYRVSAENLDDDRTWQPTALLATDQGRYRRSGTGSVLLFRENETIVLARGGIRLMTVPFRGQPEDVRISARTFLRELRWLEGVPPPPIDEERVFPISLATSCFLSSSLVTNGSFPASQQWQRWGGGKDVTVQWDESGEVTLAAEEAKERAYLAFPISVNGACDVVFRLNEATPGTGVFLADRERRPIGGVGFFRHHQSGKLLFGFHSAQDDSWERGVNPSQPLAVTDGTQFFRFSVCAGALRWWVSADGKIWSLVEPSSIHVDRRPVYCGLFITRGSQRRISLREIYVYEGMTPVVEELGQLTREVPDTVPMAPDWDRWCECVICSCPDTATLHRWRMACAFRTIAENPPAHVGQRVIEQLWDDFIDCELPATEKWAGSAIFASLVSTADWGTYERLMPRLRRLAWQTAVEHPERAFTSSLDQLLRLPYWAQWRLPVFFSDLYRHEMFSALARNDPQKSEELGDRVRWAAVPGCDVVSDELRFLGELMVSRVQTEGVRVGIPNAQIRQPLSVGAQRSAYNFSREIEAALAGGDDQHIARLVLLAGQEETQALYQDVRDRNRWSSFSLFLRDLFEARPGAQQLVLEKAQELGRVQLRQAQTLGREDLGEAVLSRFPDTPISAEAALWLGDRYLVLGDQARAAIYYKQIGPNAPLEIKHALRERAAACPGIGLLNEQRQQADLHDLLVFANDIPSIDPTVAHFFSEGFRSRETAFTLERRFAVEGPGIRRPHSMPEREFNWLKEQVTFSPFDDCFLMHAQADLRAFAWGGALIWSQQSTVSSDNAVRAMVQMYPVLDQDRLIGRLLTQRGSELVCLDFFDGHFVWTRHVGDHVVSDPWLQDDHLYALVATGSEFETYQLVLVSLDIRDGSVRHRSPLVVLSNAGDEPGECQVVPMGERFLVQANGSLMLFDCLGHPIWLRRFPWISPASSSWWHAQSWYAQRNSKPLVVGDHIFVSMRGGWFAASVDLNTGKLRWYQPVGHSVGIFAYTRGKLYLETLAGMWIMDGATGRKLGEYDWRPKAEKLAVPEARQVITFRLRGEQQHRGERSLRLECFRIDDGELIREIELPLADHELQWVGPVISHMGKVFVFLARPNNPRQLEVYELVLEHGRDEHPQLSHIGLLN